jgi:hypothetical protein
MPQHRPSALPLRAEVSLGPRTVATGEAWTCEARQATASKRELAFHPPVGAREHISPITIEAGMVRLSYSLLRLEPAIGLPH